jgi:hypothetical protein
MLQRLYGEQLKRSFDWGSSDLQNFVPVIEDETGYRRYAAV